MLVTKAETLRTGVTASDAALTLKIAPAMAKEHLLTAETKGIKSNSNQSVLVETCIYQIYTMLTLPFVLRTGLLCRDMSPDGLRFYFNLFPEIDPIDLHM